MANDLQVIEGEAVGLVRTNLDPEQAKRAFDLLPVSEITREDYKNRIGDFLEFIQINGLNRNTLLDYRKHLESRTDYSISTKNKYFTTAKRYAGILYNAKLLPLDLGKDISGKDLKGFKQSKKHKKDGVQDDEIAKIAEYFKSLPDEPKTKRLKTIFSLLVYQGLRQVEIARLDVTDLDLRTNKAFVLGKGRDDKEPIALHPYTVEAIKDYLEAYKKRSGALFTSESHNRTGERLTTRSIRKIVKVVLDSLDIHNSTHGFRHYFTTNLIKNYKGDLLTVAHYTRHRNLEMLQVYNDQLNAEQDLPRYIEAFERVKL
ncbi:tyrosine-type recombinase/integrase [uncultured Capnocytophaga sp.]|uniref:tyrosine-type recombinase/integrase n=1 Tax=uncultured Capnocytophaga sp. TaxID=159273 RepID=UPI002595DDFC|nr:tyrosine-type recombinase/integrase [uncultured Capnocytophaga sp.]